MTPRPDTTQREYLGTEHLPTGEDDPLNEPIEEHKGNSSCKE